MNDDSTQNPKNGHDRIKSEADSSSDSSSPTLSTSEEKPKRHYVYSQEQKKKFKKDAAKRRNRDWHKKNVKKALGTENVPRDKLSPRQKMLVDEYLVDLCWTSAARRAGYADSTINKALHRITYTPSVQKYLRERLLAQQQRTNVTADQVVYELARVAFSDIRDIFDEDGTLRKVKDLPDHIAAAISSVEIDSKVDDTGDVHTTTKIKLWNKMQALELLGKRFKLFSERFEIGGIDGQPVKFVFNFQPPEPKQLIEPPPIDLVEDQSDVPGLPSPE